MNKILFIFLTIPLLLWSCNTKDNKVKSIHFISQYDSIRLISYNAAREAFTGTDNLKIESNTITIPNIKFIDDLILTTNYSKNIFDVLLSKPDNSTMAACYNPRHVLLFYKRNKIAGFFEFCASCGGSYKSNNIKIPSMCSEQGRELIKIFKEMKLKNDGQEDEDFKYW